MRVAIVTETWSPAVNGVVTRLRHTVPELVARGYGVLLVTPRPFADPMPGARVEAVASLSIPFIYGGHLWGLPLRHAFGLVEDFRPYVMHAVSPMLLGWAAEDVIWAVVRRLHSAADVNLAAGAPVIAARPAASENVLEGLPAPGSSRLTTRPRWSAPREVMGTGLSRSELRSAARTRVLDWSGPPAWWKRPTGSRSPGARRDRPHDARERIPHVVGRTRCHAAGCGRDHHQQLGAALS